MQRSSFHTLGRGGNLLLHRSTSAADDQADASAPTDRSGGGLAGALARRQRSALVALACPDDLPPTATPSRLHLQAQQRARCALGCHERACDSGYRPHLRAAATARAVLAVAGGLAPDAAAAAAERQELHTFLQEQEMWSGLHEAVRNYHEAYSAVAAPATALCEPEEALACLRAATQQLEAHLSQFAADIVAQNVASLAPRSREEAEACLRTTAVGPVLYEPVLGVSPPSWLLWREVDALTRARAALLLHCYSLLGDVDPRLDKLLRTHMHGPLPFGSSVLTPGMLHRGRHRALAAALTEALLQGWGLMPGGAAAADGGADGGSGGDWPAGAPLTCAEIRALALVLSWSQALSYRHVRAPDLGTGYIGNRGVLAGLTRPAVLLRVARVLSSDVVARTPPGFLADAVQVFLDDLEDLWGHTLRAVAATNGRSLGGGGAAAAAREGGGGADGALRAAAWELFNCPDGDEAGPQQAVLLWALRREFSSTQADFHQGRAARRAAHAAERLSSLAAAADAGRADVAGAWEVRQQAQARLLEVQRGVQVHNCFAAVMATAAARVVGAFFDPLPPPPPPAPAAAPGAAVETSSDSAACAAPPAAATATATKGARLSLQQQDPALACAHPLPLPARPPPPPPLPVPKTVVCMPSRGVQQELATQYGEHRTLVRSDETRFGAGWRLAIMHSANQIAIATAQLGALAPCWYAVTTAAAPPSCSYSAHSSLVLQGAPAICYSLARTAAVNYVLDRVARGLAAACQLFPPPAAAGPPGAHAAAASTASAPHTRGAAAEVCGGTDPASATAARAGLAPATVAAVLAAAKQLSGDVAVYHASCGWPLVVSLSGSSGEGERAQHARKVPAELLRQFDPSGLDVEALRQVCVSATWCADTAALYRVDELLEHEEAAAAALEPGAAASSAAAAAPPSPSPTPISTLMSTPLASAAPGATAAGERVGSGEAAVGSSAAGGAQAAPAMAATSSAGGSAQSPLLAKEVAQRMAAAGSLLAHFPDHSSSGGGGGAEDALGGMRALVERPLQTVLLRPTGEQHTAAIASACAELSEELRTDAAARRELVVVPLLDAAALQRCGEAHKRLRGIVRLVLRDLTVPVVAAAGAATAAADGAAGTVEHVDGDQQDTAAVLDLTQPRWLRANWQYLLPLALNRAVCGIAGVPLPAIGWSQEDLCARTEQRQPQPHTQEEQEQEEEDDEEGEKEGQGDKGEKEEQGRKEKGERERGESRVDAAGVEDSVRESGGSSEAAGRVERANGPRDSSPAGAATTATAALEAAGAEAGGSGSGGAGGGSGGGGAGGPRLHVLVRQLATHMRSDAPAAPGGAGGAVERPRAAEAAAEAEAEVAQAAALRALDEALTDLAEAGGTAEDDDDDSLRAILRELEPSMRVYGTRAPQSPLDELVPCRGGEGGGGSPAGAAPQALQLLLLEAQPGRPTELVSVAGLAV
ncbi:hypothetical protein HXX76_002477 [Chlamydomonas incerta]|uniref:Uncharacterized protein n=1 Tax=Chlamydomonas incerta TaxID=51695 RepID=A0A835W9T7_CHLIN|nr:hypothetical protein HXX76_002477 [Chlamydomonas incerta]|eukprot:KAG2442391.1 hypothetical protein HXX76_002477 [Chlamydomonas incerta]